MDPLPVIAGSADVCMADINLPTKQGSRATAVNEKRMCTRLLGHEQRIIRKGPMACYGQRGWTKKDWIVLKR
jgi:hypothetical protein